MDEFLKKFPAISTALETGFSFFVEKIKEAVSDLKEVDTILTEISKTNDKLAKSDLAGLKDKAFEAAGKYGRKPQDYLANVREASLAGYDNAAEIAELSMAAQNAGGMTAELAGQMIQATDRAYQMNGSVSELTRTLDGCYSIASHNTVSMSDFSDAISAVGSEAASFGVRADETAAAVGTISTATKQSGTESAQAFRSILLHIRQVADEENGITPDGLVKYKQACSDLGISLQETKDGVLSLRDPMEVLKELSSVYNTLGENDVKKKNLLDSIGGGADSSQLDALLSNWGTYQAMLQQYASGSGSLAEAAAKTANSWEGSLARLSSTWTNLVGNIADSDGMTAAIDGLNGLLSATDTVTEKIGSLGTIGLGAGLFASLKNVGKDNMHSFSYICFE